MAAAAALDDSVERPKISEALAVELAVEGESATEESAVGACGAAAVAAATVPRQRSSASQIEATAPELKEPNLDPNRHIPFELSVAPMMKWTDRHFRWMFRLLTKRTILYTEMVVNDTILHRMGELEEYSECFFNHIENKERAISVCVAMVLGVLLAKNEGTGGKEILEQLRYSRKHGH